MPFLNDTAEQLTGVGTGIGADQLRHKIEVIERAIELHHKHVTGDAFKTLCAVGGLKLRQLQVLISAVRKWVYL